MHTYRKQLAFLFDIDGTLIRGGKALPRAKALLDAVRDRFVLLSNNAEHTPAELSGNLRVFGLDVPSERIVLAGTAALDQIAQRRPGARVMVVSTASLHAYARSIGLTPVEREADVVMLGRDRDFTYDRLANTANAVRSGAELVVANPDLVHPGCNGAIVPETGALLAALLACTGRMPYRVVGKPEPALFHAALTTLNVAAEDALMVGDNPSTDGEGARRLGIRFLEIKNGELPDPAMISAISHAKGIDA